MQSLFEDTHYTFYTTNIWFNFQDHHHHEYAAMVRPQDRATQANHYRINRFITGKQTIVKPSTIVSIASATIMIVKKALSLSTNYQGSI